MESWEPVMTEATALYLQEEKGKTEIYQLQNNVTIRIKSSWVNVWLRPKCVHIDGYHKLYFSYAELYFLQLQKKTFIYLRFYILFPSLQGKSESHAYNLYLIFRFLIGYLLWASVLFCF